ncbi:Cu(I)/Ag(I) efflux system membrane protein CusA/SilA [Hydrogenispora ethanolica]|uniref:Cu(I)/Ag(I) efflux system membrane protein CusA/SilA n=1 Tax=Hydrogenispora ethanolica TaxID=1082276 RepID=A0A4R1R2Z1_HYDET|nr:CusA/CzcA family heavy metal efflux RND transporter [Hydrogenispora ethanolica]TCL59718.1 Cu(I)/Ag(I) efflux system membrane protein CusA/SilA [Hydrogenispora ethanolica]
MIERIIEWSARNRAFVFIGVVAVVFWAIWAIHQIPLDAIPDLTDTQVIVYARWDRPPQIIEDQVSYPIVSALLGAPKVKDIRAFSDYGFSYVYIIFEDGTDVYWARSRVMEYLSKVSTQLPQGVKLELGPDATGLGWIYQYALVDRTGRNSLADLRRFQDWQLKYALQAVKGVSEVASIGGFVNQYQITLDPKALAVYQLSVSDVVRAVQSANEEVGARLLDIAGREFMVTVRGYIKGKDDIGAIVLKSMNGFPVTIKDVAKISLGPDMRRGLADFNGMGETVGGIVIMRYGENAMNVIHNVKEKLKEIQLPEGVELIPVYDRSTLIQDSIKTLSNKLFEEMIVVALVILVFLMHVPSAMVPIVTLPIAVLFSFIPMKYLGLTSNIMSLGGIAIAIGAMVDASIVMIENGHKQLHLWQARGEKGDYREVLIGSMQEVGRPSFFSLIVIGVSFLPIFTLEGIEGRLFRPLAFTKNFAMFFGALLAITLVPAIQLLFIRVKKFHLKPGWLNGMANKVLVGTIHSEEDHPLSRALFKIYGPVIDFVLKYPKRVILAAALVFALSMPVFLFIGSEFMPPLNEGSILYMPTTLPGISVTEASKILQMQDKIIKSFPEVATVFGKAGRAETSTDSAPFSMMETTIVLKPEAEWREKRQWYSGLPEFLKGPFRLFWPDRISYEELLAQMTRELRIPGQVNMWAQPIKGRIDMLTTGVRTPVGIKIYGDDIAAIERIGKQIELHVPMIRGTRSVYAERTSGGYFVDINLKRDEIARYGLSVEEVQMNLMYAVGGENITQTIEGRERFPINLRYPRELRDTAEKIRQVYITTMAGVQVPLSQLAEVTLTTGPGMIRDENGRLAGYVFVDPGNRDIGGYVTELKATIAKNVKIPPGYVISYSGQYESMERVKNRMLLIIPVTLAIIFFLLYFNTRSYVKTAIILLAVPFSLIGVAWALFLLKYNLSIGVWCGIIALLGVDAETGVFMLLYLDLAYDSQAKEGRMKTLADLKAAIHEGAVKRIRPKMMTVAVMFMGLLPIMWAPLSETGADMMKRIAAPMVGGIFVSFLMELAVYPAIYLLWRKRSLANRSQQPAAHPPDELLPPVTVGAES